MVYNSAYNPIIHHRRSIRLRGYDYSQAGTYFITIVTRYRENLFGRIENGVMILNDFGNIAKNEWLKTSEIRPNIKLDIFIIMPNHIHGIIIINDNDRGESGRDELNNEKKIIDRGELNKTYRGELQFAPTIRFTPTQFAPTEIRFGPTQFAPTIRFTPTQFAPTEIRFGPTQFAPTIQFTPTKFQSPSKTIGAIVRGFKSAVTKQINIFRNTSGNPVWQRNYFEHIVRIEEELNRIRKYIQDNPSKWGNNEIN